MKSWWFFKQFLLLPSCIILISSSFTLMVELNQGTSAFLHWMPLNLTASWPQCPSVPSIVFFHRHKLIPLMLYDRDEHGESPACELLYFFPAPWGILDVLVKADKPALHSFCFLTSEHFWWYPATEGALLHLVSPFLAPSNFFPIFCFPTRKAMAMYLHLVSAANRLHGWKEKYTVTHESLHLPKLMR